ncbi:hypothetical protein EMIT0P43_30252 [Pseudomonas jessenii]
MCIANADLPELAFATFLLFLFKYDKLISSYESSLYFLANSQLNDCVRRLKVDIPIDSRTG